MIALRKRFRVITGDRKEARCSYPPQSIHSEIPWKTNYNADTRMVGVMYAGRSSYDNNLDELVYFGVNAYWGDVNVELPTLPTGYVWKLYVDTGRQADEVIAEKENIFIYNRRFLMHGRTVIVLVAEKM